MKAKMMRLKVELDSETGYEQPIGRNIQTQPPLSSSDRISWFTPAMAKLSTPANSELAGETCPEDEDSDHRSGAHHGST